MYLAAHEAHETAHMWNHTINYGEGPTVYGDAVLRYLFVQAPLNSGYAVAVYFLEQVILPHVFDAFFIGVDNL